MELKCSYPDCQSDWNEKHPSCLCGEVDYRNCENYLADIADAEAKPEKNPASSEDSLLPWNGSAMGLKDLGYISARHHPFVIGIAGQHKAGKTTFLATVYMLLRGGRNIGGYQFGGSYSLIGWEKIAGFLTFNGNKKISFPPHTSANMTRVPGLLHFLLKDGHGVSTDVLFTDAPGEWFSDWAKSANSHVAAGARWIDDNASAYILVADCDAFKKNVGKERHNLMQIVDRLKNTIGNRPAALLWTKTDVGLDQNVRDKITELVRAQLPTIQSYGLAVVNRKSDEDIDSALQIIDSVMNTWRFNGAALKEIGSKNQEDIFLSIRHA